MSLRLNQKADMDLIAKHAEVIWRPRNICGRNCLSLRPELRYAGILPPLRTPHHPLGKKAVDLKVGDFTERASRFRKSEKGMLVDVGVDKLALISGSAFTSGKASNREN
jgi:predicted SPOUT superfamily RNA methylase MTH1